LEGRWSRFNAAEEVNNCQFYLLSGLLRGGAILGLCVFYLRQSGRPLRERLAAVLAAHQALREARRAVPQALGVLVCDGNMPRLFADAALVPYPNRGRVARLFTDCFLGRMQLANWHGGDTPRMWLAGYWT